MNPTGEIENRIDSLKSKLNEGIRRPESLARNNHWISLSLMGIALTSTTVAGLGGLLFEFNSKVVSTLALVPGALALVENTFKFQDRSNWHYRKKTALEGLKSRLLWQLPESPSADNVAAIAKDLDKLEERMDDEWRRTFKLAWRNITHQDQLPHDTGDSVKPKSMRKSE